MKRQASSERPDVYARVTDKIITQLETGVRPWARPWTSAGSVSRPRRHDGTPYSGINILLLWSEASVRGFANATWMTFRQALSLGAAVRKGETGSTVVYADRLKSTRTNDAGEEEVVGVPFLKAYTVFNVEQIDGLPASYTPEVSSAPVAPPAAIAGFFNRIGADVREGGDAAYYAPQSDHVQMPPFDRFTSTEAYYAVLGHELTHWTSHARRLDRDFGGSRFGDEGYAREELVAELGAAFLCADLGLALEPRDDHAAYIGSWLKVLRNDKRFIVSAAAHAQKAVAFLHETAGPP